ncbi:MAG: hypothetical protein A3K00_05495 [Gallionellales bacterium RIFOXYD2_FULL_52_7]|nr:MAG: hypothetical protein A3K00_05495 [Gallionellales bacterium RIFOXYD2_FULL_52_7]
MLIESLLQARLHDPFALLGLHREGREWVIRFYEPHATQVSLLDNGETLKKIHPDGLFEWRGANEPAQPYRLRISQGSVSRDIYDCYQFPANISEQDLFLFSEGNLRQGYRMLGSHAVEINGVKAIPAASYNVLIRGFRVPLPQCTHCVIMEQIGSVIALYKATGRMSG